MKISGLIKQKFLGIDIGTSSIKIVELSSWAGRKKLENYGEIPASALYKKPFRTFEKSTLSLPSEDIVRAIKAVFEEANIKTKKVIFSIPDFSSFFTSFELPFMDLDEVPQAVKSEARRHVPIPLGEVTLDWQIIGEFPRDKEEKIKILLVTVPNEIINQYQGIAAGLEVELLSLEAEVFGLIRSLIANDQREVTGLIDIGARSTTCSIIENRVLRVSRSFDISGNSFTERISKGLSVDYETAEDLKKKYGISFANNEPKESNVREILVPLIDLIVREVEKIFMNFNWRNKKEVKKIIISGGDALLPGLLEHFKDYFSGKEVEIANPFSEIYYPPILDKTLREMGPSYAIALGMALRGIE